MDTDIDIRVKAVIDKHKQIALSTIARCGPRHVCYWLFWDAVMEKFAKDAREETDVMIICDAIDRTNPLLNGLWE